MTSETLMPCGCTRIESPGPNGGIDVEIAHVVRCTATGRLPIDGLGARTAAREIAWARERETRDGTSPHRSRA